MKLMKSAVDYYFDLGDRLARERAENLANQKSSLFNQLYPQTIQSQLASQAAEQRLRNAQTLREQLFSQHPELLAGSLGQQEFLRQKYGSSTPLGQYIEAMRQKSLMPSTSQDPLAKQRALLDLVRTSPSDSVENRLAKAELRNMAAPRGGTSVTVDGQTVSFGGSQPGTRLFPEDFYPQQSGQSGQISGISTITQPSAKSRAGMTYVDSNGQRYSVETSPVLTQNQKSSAAIQNILDDLPKLKYLAAYQAPLSLGFFKRKYKEAKNYFDNDIEYQNFVAAHQLYKSMIDNLMNAFNVPRTNKGLETIEESISPAKGENIDQYENRLNNLIIPNLLKRYHLINERLHKGLPVYDLMESKELPIQENIGSGNSINPITGNKVSSQVVDLINLKTGRRVKMPEDIAVEAVKSGLYQDVR